MIRHLGCLGLEGLHGITGEPPVSAPLKGAGRFGSGAGIEAAPATHTLPPIATFGGMDEERPRDAFNSGKDAAPRRTVGEGHVWTAPAVQEESYGSAKRSGAAMYPAFECSRCGCWP